MKQAYTQQTPHGVAEGGALLPGRLLRPLVESAALPAPLASRLGPLGRVCLPLQTAPPPSPLAARCVHAATPGVADSATNYVRGVSWLFRWWRIPAPLVLVAFCGTRNRASLLNPLPCCRGATGHELHSAQ